MAEILPESKHISNLTNYEKSFEAFRNNGFKEDPTWLQTIRISAMDRFLHLGFPSVRDEYWKYTNIAPIAESTFHFSSESAPVSYDEISKFCFERPDWPRIVFVNGIFSAQLSSRRKQNGLIATNLREQIHSNPSFIEPYIGRYADFYRSPFTALNMAFAKDGAFVHLSEGMKCEDPIHLIFISTQTGNPLLVPIRNVIVVEKNAKVAVVENYFSFGKTRYFNNVVSEIILKENASLKHHRIQRESTNAFHVGVVQAHLEQKSSFSSSSVALGGQLVRNNINAKLAGEAAACSLFGLYMVSDTQHVDHHTLVDHPKPGGISHQLYKGLVAGRATAVFSGKILVREEAQKTDAHQTNKNLLLSKQATVNTKPQLEILADDVKCTHGAAVGQLEDEAIFYLKTRGIDPDEAAKLLSYGFASEVIDSIGISEVKEELNQIVLSRLNDPAYLGKRI